MEDRKEYLKKLFSVSMKTEVEIAPGLYDKLIELGRRKFGNLPKDVLISKSVTHAAALGAWEWEREYSSREKKSGKK